MENLINWLKENIGDDINISTQQFERTKKLDFEYVPRTEEQFLTVVTTAPFEILKGLGFGKWDTMNNIIKENASKPISKKISIPIINIPGENFEFETGRKDHPIEPLEVDEDIILIPGEWYNVIPNGFIVTGLYGEKYPFLKGKTDDDTRYGCLPFGITRPIHPKPYKP